MKTVNKFPACLPFCEGRLNRQIQKMCFQVRDRGNCHHKTLVLLWKWVSTAVSCVVFN